MASKIIHLEKKTKLRHARRFTLQGSTLSLWAGPASEQGKTVVLSRGSAKAAEQTLARWLRAYADQGFARVEVDGWQAGVIATLEGSSGPGRVRLDGSTDVRFDVTAHPGLALVQGQRVLVDGVHEAKGRAPSFMFGKKGAVKSLRVFPEPTWGEVPKPRELSASAARALIKAAGPRLLGRHRGAPLRGAKPGDWLFTYERGIARHLGTSGDMVDYEEVFTSKLRRATGFTSGAVDVFCSRLPMTLQRLLERAIAHS